MSTTLKTVSLILLGIAATTATAFSAVKSDIGGFNPRRETLATAQKLAEPPQIIPIPSDVVLPFNPVAFGQPDAEELQAIAAAKAAEAAAINKSKPATEADLLARIGERVVPSGMVRMNNEPLLIFAQKRLSVGDHLTVTYDGKDYVVEITAIDKLTFKLRLNRAEITRRINPGKNP